VNGAVVSTARRIDITLSTGAVVQTTTIAPGNGLAKSIRFFIARIPCGTQAKTAIGRNDDGKVVALAGFQLGSQPSSNSPA
jgi:hypothetical protein